MAKSAQSERNQPDREQSNQDRRETPREPGSRQSRNLARSARELSDNLGDNMDNFMAPFFDMQRQVNRVMESMFASMTDVWSAQPEKMMPKIRVWEDSESFHLKTRLPHNNPDNVEVAINDNILTLRWHEDQREDRGPHQFFSSHDAYRTVIIPDNADPDKAEAIFKNGALEVIVPKKEGAGENARSIPIRKSA